MNRKFKSTVSHRGWGYREDENLGGTSTDGNFGGGGQTQPTQQTQSNNQQTSQNNQNDKNNTGNDDDLLADLWNKPKQENQTQQQQQQQQTQQTNNSNPEEQVKTYLETVGLGDFNLSEEDKAALQGDNPEQVFAKLNKRMQDAHLNTMRNVSSMIDKAVAKSVETAKQNTQDAFSANGFKAKMHEKMPLTADPQIAPVAETVARQLLQQGKTQEQALRGVELWFKKISSMAGDGNSETNRNMNAPFKNSDEDDWMEFFKQG